MARFQLRLLKIPEEARAKVVETGRTSGPPLNRKKFNSVLMGTEALPAIIAKSDVQGPISSLRQRFADAGCKIQLIDNTRAVSLGDKVLGLKANFQQLKQWERYAVIAVSTIFAVAMVMLFSFSFNFDEEARLKQLSRPGSSADSKRSSVTGIRKAQRLVNRADETPPSKTPYGDFLNDLPSLSDPCNEKKGDYDCMLRGFREGSKTSTMVAIKEGNSHSVSDTDYLRVLHYRFFQCLAEEQSRPLEDDQDLVNSVLNSLSRPMVYRFGRTNCDRDRSSMYECIKQTRTLSCHAIYDQLHGALVEYQNQKPTQEWTGQFADYYGDKLLVCLAEEQKRHISPLERAQVHLFRYRIAQALEKVENTCQEHEYVACGRSIYEGECKSIVSLLKTNPDRIVQKMILDCNVLKECR